MGFRGQFKALVDLALGKMRKRRTTFTREQLANMEKMFQKHPYLTPGQRADLAKSLKLAQIQVQVSIFANVFDSKNYKSRT